MIEYRSYVPADRDAVLRLLAEGMTPAEKAAKATTFDWQFLENPHDDGRSPFLLGIDGNGIVAVEGLMPARIIYRGERRTAVWSCDTHVAASHRRMGISREVVRQLGDCADVVLAYGISDVMEPVFERLGFQISRELAGYSFDIRAHGVIGGLKNLRTRLFRLGWRMTRPESVEVSVHPDADFGPEVDELWARSAPTYDSVVERDAAYLNWKYRRHPRLSYCCYAARRDAQLSGLLVARPDRDMSLIVDYCGPLRDDRLMVDLVSAAVDDLCDRGTASIHCETTDPGMARALRRNGFRRSHGDYRFRVRCNYLDDPYPARDFFLMTGDSDNDFTALTSAAGSTYVTRPDAAKSRVARSVD